MKRKISSCVNVRIRAGDYQHIEVVKYAEEEIEFNSNEELVKKEDELHSDIVECLLRSLKSTADRLGKGKAEAIVVEQTLAKAIPEWLANGPVPNIANGAKKVLNTVADKQKSEKEKIEKDIKSILPDEDGRLVKNNNAPIVEQKKEEKIVKAADDVGDLFEDDTKIVAEVVSEPIATKNENKASKDNDGFDIFADSDDLFDGK